MTIVNVARIEKNEKCVEAKILDKGWIEFRAISSQSVAVCEVNMYNDERGLIEEKLPKNEHRPACATQQDGIQI